MNRLRKYDGLAMWLVSSTWVAGCQPTPHDPADPARAGATSAHAATVAPLLVVPLRTPQLATYPCVEQCHKERDSNPQERELTEFHSRKQLQHGDTTFWCNFCHNEADLDTLRLLDKRVVGFDESHRLCGQCHGDKRRDWEAGIHGLQTGSFRGAATTVRRACTACHDAHAPRRPRFQALPAPMKPRGVP